MRQNVPIDMVLFTACESAQWLLKRCGAVFPFGITFAGVEAKPTTFFPKDQHPNSTWEELLDLVEDELRRQALSSETCAVVAITEMESEGKRAFAVQAETRFDAVVMLYPFKKSIFRRWKIGRAMLGTELLVSQILVTPERN